MSDTDAMMDDVRRLAKLARIEVAEADLPAFAKEFKAILAYVGKLDDMELPPEGTGKPAIRNVLRADEHPYENGTWTELLVAQFPEKDGDSLAVKQIITHE